MDGSIATSASVRLREQLRGAFHAPAGDAQAGLFEELLRMPVLQSRPDSKPKASDGENDVLAEAAAAKSGQKSSTKPAREKASDADDDARDDEPAENAEATALVPPVPTQPSVVEAPPQPAKKVAATAKDAAAQAQPGVHDAANADQQSRGNHKEPAAAAGDQPAQTVATSQAPAATAEDSGQPQVVDAAPEQPTAPAVESAVPTDQPQAAVTASPEGDAAQSDRTPHRAAEAKTAAKDANQVQAAPVAAPAQAQAGNESHAQAKPQDQPQTHAASPTDAQSAVPQAQAPADKPSARDDDDGDRRDKWFLKDSDRPRADDVKADAASAKHDRPAVDLPPPVPAAADPTSAPAGSDALAALDNTVSIDGAPSVPQVDLSALASAAAQSSVGGSGGTGGSAGAARSDARAASPSVGQVTGSPASTSASNQASAAGKAERDKGGVAALSQQERVRLVQRVARSFSRLGPEGGQVTLKLHPPQLGVLNMSVRIEGQSMTAKLHTETAGARDAILENLPVLRERLAEQGIEVESFHVEVTGDRNLAADSQSQSQAQNAFGGESSDQSRGGPRSVDYRRFSRSGSDLQAAGAASMRGSDIARWSMPSLPERTLDIRA